MDNPLKESLFVRMYVSARLLTGKRINTKYCQYPVKEIHARNKHQTNYMDTIYLRKENLFLYLFPYTQVARWLIVICDRCKVSAAFGTTFKSRQKDPFVQPLFLSQRFELVYERWINALYKYSRVMIIRGTGGQAVTYSISLLNKDVSYSTFWPIVQMSRCSETGEILSHSS